MTVTAPLGFRAAGVANVSVIFDLSAGSAVATVRTTDLTAAYVHENSA